MLLTDNSYPFWMGSCTSDFKNLILQYAVDVDIVNSAGQNVTTKI